MLIVISRSTSKKITKNRVKETRLREFKWYLFNTKEGSDEEIEEQKGHKTYRK